ncbi:MAG: hypothetical protein M3Z64_11750, partial [Verrucomicrobiota bacterium]|nr:hypothetical protein [Verrucomicrobiota bacterium]
MNTDETQIGNLEGPVCENLATPSLRPRWLGRINFADALALQEEIVARKRHDHSLGDELLLLEHEPVYTIGRTPDQRSLRGAA